MRGISNTIIQFVLRESGLIRGVDPGEGGHI